MKQSKGRISRMIGISVGIMLLFTILQGCDGSMNEATIQMRAQKYLASQYSADFSILKIRRVPNGTGPIPRLRPSYHWEVTVQSSEFTDDTFAVYYRQDEWKRWYWSDDYYSVLFQDEVVTAVTDRAQSFFGVDCIVQPVWGILPWPKGVDKTCSLTEWLEAGGEIFRIEICLKDYVPSDEDYKAFGAELLAETPYTDILGFVVLDEEGFRLFSKSKEDIVDFWNQHSEFHVDQGDYINGEFYR